MKSIEDDLLEDFFMSLRTSAGLTKANVSNRVPVNGRSGILVGQRKDETLPSLMVRILVMKTSESHTQSLVLGIVKSRSEE